MGASFVGWVVYFDHTWASTQEKSRRGLVLLEHGDGFVEIAPGVSTRPRHAYCVEVPLIATATGFAVRTFIDLDDAGAVAAADIEPVALLPFPFWQAVWQKMAEYGDAEDR